MPNECIERGVDSNPHLTRSTDSYAPILVVDDGPTLVCEAMRTRERGIWRSWFVGELLQLQPSARSSRGADPV
jgi:hypothetical protein